MFPTVCVSDRLSYGKSCWTPMEVSVLGRRKTCRFSCGLSCILQNIGLDEGGQFIVALCRRLEKGRWTCIIKGSTEVYSCAFSYSNRKTIPTDLSLECLVRIPYCHGIAATPLGLLVSVEAGCKTKEDAGSIAGMLFSLGQDDQDTQAFKLLKDLERTHGLEIDFDEGLVRVSVEESKLYDGIAEMAKVVLAMHTVVPLIAVGQPVFKKRSDNHVQH